MQFSDLQAQIAANLEQRTDLQQVIFNYVANRVQYWQRFFFYSSDVTDTSVTTTPGQYFYNLPNSMRSVLQIRLLIPGNNTTFAVTTATIVLPVSVIPVTTTLGFQPNGTLLIAGQNVQYTGITQNSFTGCSGGTGTVGQGAGVTQIPPVTTTTAPVTLPATSIPVVSTAGFLAAGQLNFGGTQVSYGSTDATDFLTTIGGVAGTYATGTTVQQIYGIWIPLDRQPYKDILNADTLAPPNQAQPSLWAQYGAQIRLYPNPDQAYMLEFTGSEAPAAPVNDSDDNFWTEDAAWLIIYGTCAEIYQAYLQNDEAAGRFRALEQREYKALLKITRNLAEPEEIKFHW